MATLYRVNMQMADNEDLRQAFALTDQTGAAVDLTGAVLRMDIEPPNGIDALEISTANGRILTADPTLGQFEIQVPASLMRTIPEGVYRHDLILTRTGHAVRIWDGVLTLSRGVTE